MTWTAATFKRATVKGPVEASGYTSGGLGITQVSPVQWDLIHLNTGHRLCQLIGRPEEVQRIASEAVLCGPWDALATLDALKNTKGLMARLRAVLRSYPEKVYVYDPSESRRVASRVLTERRGGQH